MTETIERIIDENTQLKAKVVEMSEICGAVDEKPKPK